MTTAADTKTDTHSKMSSLESEELTNHRCDRCGANSFGLARVAVRDKAVAQDLAFCGHHFSEALPALRENPLVIEILDCRDLLTQS